MRNALLILACLFVGCESQTNPPASNNSGTNNVASSAPASNSQPSWANDQEAINAIGQRLGDPDRRKLFQDLRAYRPTQLTRQESGEEPPQAAPEGMGELVQYPAPLGDQWAYIVEPAEAADGPQPAVIYLTGGFSNEIDPFVFEEQDPANDQSGDAYWKSGHVVMYPSLRGGHDNPGSREGIYGEVDDVLAALQYLKSRPSVDPERVFLVGHSTGGTLALLVAALSDEFASVVAYGPVATAYSYGDVIPANFENDLELFARTPGYWLAGITAPTFIIEGDDGNIDSLQLMLSGFDGAVSNQDAPLTFCELKGHGHFSLLQPANKFIAKQITSGAKQLAFTSEELADACTPVSE